MHTKAVKVMKAAIKQPIKVEKPSKKLLLIDDNPIDNIISQRYIKDSNLVNECLVIDSSIDAYDYLFDEIDATQDFPDLILLDLNMPVYSGFEFLDKIEKIIDGLHLNSKVVVLSSSSNPSDIKRAKSYKFVIDYFIKPLNREQVNKMAELL